jgi:signal transduction histidine kinase
MGQLLTGLLFLIEGHGARSPDVKGKMREIVDDLIRRVRDLSMTLRPPMLDDLGLLPALTWQIDRFAAQTAFTCSSTMPASIDVSGPRSRSRPSASSRKGSRTWPVTAA